MLYIKECKKVLFSLTFIIYFIAVLAMYYTQFDSDSESVSKPVPGRSDYGTIAKEVPEILMPNAAEQLVGEYLSGSYTAYPYGFIKYVKLKEKDKARMAEIIYEVSGITQEQIDAYDGYDPGGYQIDEDGNMIYLAPKIPEVKIPDNLTYAHFRELMREADEIIGGGSMYGDSYIVRNFSRVSKTYEDALSEYEQFVNEDRITTAYARLYCDYLGIAVSALPVFCAVALAHLDKKSRMSQLVYARKISSVKLIFTRFFSLVTVMLIPVVITAVLAYMKVKSIYPNNDLDNLAIFKYALFWLVPNIMTAAAVGMLITEGISGLLAIFVQGAWWFASIFSGSSGLTGNIKKFTLVMRHNSLMGQDVFTAQWNNIIYNRIFFTVISLLAVALTAFIYDKKRRGIYHGL